MGRAFRGKLSKLGDSLAVILPKKMVEEARAREGDLV